jgi:REP element-mobilizing transposase RayT
MVAAEPHPRRKSIRLSPENYRGDGLYFVTICCAHRRPLFRDPARAQRLLRRLRETASRYAFAIHAYCVMPDHVHLLAAGQSAASDLLRFIHRFKTVTAQEEMRLTGQGLWQRYFYDHVVRPNEPAAAVAAYIWMNPVRKGLCQVPHQYPFVGSFTEAGEKWRKVEAVWTPPWKKRM